MADNGINFDDYAPPDIAKKVEAAGIKKANLPFLSVALLAILAGSFIAIAGTFFTLVTFDSQLSIGITRLLGGLVFSLGLILVVIAGAELFTGNNLLVMGFASRVVTFKQLVFNWVIVFFGNLLGSLSVVFLMYYTNLWKMGSSLWGAKAVSIALSKVNLTFFEGLTRGILCNALVCLAVWMCFSARSVVSKISAIVFPITAFVALGFEHNVANMYFIPMGIALKNNAGVMEALTKISADTDFSNLTILGFAGNILSVTIGNIIGGAVLVGLVYWLIIVLPQKRKKS